MFFSLVTIGGYYIHKSIWITWGTFRANGSSVGSTVDSMHALHWKMWPHTELEQLMTQEKTGDEYRNSHTGTTPLLTRPTSLATLSMFGMPASCTTTTIDTFHWIELEAAWYRAI